MALAIELHRPVLQTAVRGRSSGRSAQQGANPRPSPFYEEAMASSFGLNGFVT